MIITNESHLDHDIPQYLVNWINGEFGREDGFFIKTVLLPEDSTLPYRLYGPVMGDQPISEDEVFYAVRGLRKCASRLVNRPVRQDRRITVIGGPSGKNPCVLYTAFGGALAPRELGDPEIKNWIAYQESKKFWSMHALAAIRNFVSGEIV